MSMSDITKATLDEAPRYRVDSQFYGPDGPGEGRIEYFHDRDEALAHLRRNCTLAPNKRWIQISSKWRDRESGRIAQVFAANSADDRIEWQFSDGELDYSSFELFFLRFGRLSNDG